MALHACVLRACDRRQAGPAGGLCRGLSGCLSYVNVPTGAVASGMLPDRAVGCETVRMRGSRKPPLCRYLLTLS